MKARLFLFLLFLFCGSMGRACIWIDATTLEGKFISVGGAAPASGGPPLAGGVLMTSETFRATNHSEVFRVIAAMPPEQVLELSTELQDPPPDWPAELNDAVRPIFTGDFKKSAEMLAALNVKYPSNYYVCANLGVTSELTGNDTEALQWVEKAMQIKPDAHYGTEWMHAAVLRAKIAITKDPAWLEKHTISGIPPGEVPAGFFLSEGARRIELREIQDALVAHLIPRLLLVKGQDRIVAALLTELARVEARASSVEAGIGMLQLAAEHGAANTGPLLKDWEKRVAHRKMWGWLKMDALRACLLISAVMGLAAYYLHKQRSRGNDSPASVVDPVKPDPY
jgi:hypothetical protein